MYPSTKLITSGAFGTNGPIYLFSQLNQELNTKKLAT